MNLLDVWSTSALIAEVCEVISFLEDDPHYTKEEAAEKLKEILEMHIDPLYQKALQSRP